jgi:DNA-binding GntR family transcriptional regulator
MSDLAYQELRDAIFSGQLEPGARLNQDELARRLGVSRAPVRDALNRLETEGLVKTLSRTGGVVVAEASEQEMVSIYELRAILDAASTRLACERMSDEDLARLRAIVDETERVTQANDSQAIVRAHAQFHYFIYAACGNPELTRVAQNLWDDPTLCPGTQHHRERPRGSHSTEPSWPHPGAHPAIRRGGRGTRPASIRHLASERPSIAGIPGR